MNYRAGKAQRDDPTSCFPRAYNKKMTGSETVSEARALIVTSGLQQLLDRFAQEHLLRFEEPVPNLFEFLTSNTIRSSDENFLGEEDLTGFIAEVLELPFLTNAHITASPTLFARCQALGFRRDQNGRFTNDQVTVGRSLASDRRQHSETVAKRGYGDRGDRRN